MSKVIIDEEKIDKFLERGVAEIFPSKEKLKEKLMSGERLKIYQGFDPTGPYLHVGHAIGIRALKILQELGHEVIFLVGDFTSKIGDPDKGSTRKILTDDEIEKNMANWKKQAAQLIDFGGKNPVRFERNFKWLSKLQLEDVLKLMSNFTVPQILQRDLFKKRLKDETTFKLHEIVYPLMQGYDGVAMGVDIEIGGADQIFNMLVGRDLSKIYLNKEKFVRANKMMDAPDGITMSKTKGNGINLGDNAEQMFGKAMSYPDTAISSGLELLTEVSMEEIKRIEEEMKQGANPMQFKKLMAYEIVKSIKSEKEAKVAQENWEKTFSKKEIPEDLEEIIVKKDALLVDVLLNYKIIESKSEFRRLVENGAVTYMENNEKVSSTSELAQSGVYRIGKKRFCKIEIK
ncbi:MAG: tyrosine--tRNA ligase [Candidatus Paceibacterota bacterium]|jgi:tyrosyl-tRNA synthetase